MSIPLICLKDFQKTACFILDSCVLYFQKMFKFKSNLTHILFTFGSYLALNLLPEGKSLALSKLKAFADDKRR